MASDQQDTASEVKAAIEAERTRLRKEIEALPPMSQFGSASGGMMKSMILKMIASASDS